VSEARGRQRSANVEGGRQHRHELWVSPEEEAVLQVAANQQGIGYMRFVREAALTVARTADTGDLETPSARRRRMVELFELRGTLADAALEIRRVGVNVNQLARQANAGGGFPVTEARDYLVDEQSLLRRTREIAENIDSLIDQLRAEGVDV